MNEMKGQSDQEYCLSTLQGSEQPAVLSAMLQNTSPQFHERQYGEEIQGVQLKIGPYFNFLAQE